MEKRVNKINQSNACLFLSIHCNIYSSKEIFGAQTFYSNKNVDNKEFSKTIQDSLKSYLKNTNRSSNAITDKYILDNTIIPGCLVEVGFLSNENEAKLLIDNKYQRSVAYAIYLGIIKYTYETI